DGLEDRLDVGGRGADDAEDFARRRLVVEGLAEVTVAGNQLLGQPVLLDCDGRLDGEGLKQRDLPWRERANLQSAKRDDTEDRVSERRGATSIVLTRVAGMSGYWVRAIAFRSRTWMTRRSSVARP